MLTLKIQGYLPTLTSKILVYGYSALSLNSSPKELPHLHTVDNLGLLFDLQAIKIIVYKVHMNLQVDFIRVVPSFVWIILDYIASANIWVGQV